MSKNRQLGLMVAAPASGSGKTVFTLGLLRCLKNLGLDVSPAKAGPDYIDPGFHEVASGKTSVNLDPWAMNAARVQSLAARQSGSHLLVEAAMGLFDGAVDGSASPAFLAKFLNIPAVLVVDAAKQSHSIAALVRGFRDHDADLQFAGVILNRVGSPRHEAMLRQALEGINAPVLGALPRNDDFTLPERHLGLVQAGEIRNIEAFIAKAAEAIEASCDVEKLIGAFGPANCLESTGDMLKPPAQHISIARDEAFTFAYPHMLEDWRAGGAQLSAFSPLNDEAPNSGAGFVFLPGGYPELHAAKIANAAAFKAGLKRSAENGALIYGECGGYMVLGDGLIDAQGKRHAMAGLLRLETSFEKRKLHLGYRQVEATDFPLGYRLRAHEFHYTTAVSEQGERLFKTADATGKDTGEAGLRDGNVMGSYIHIIDGELS